MIQGSIDLLSRFRFLGFVPPVCRPPGSAFTYSNSRKSCGKRKRGRGLQGKAEDAGGLTPVKDDNAAIRFPDRWTFLSFRGLL